MLEVEIGMARSGVLPGEPAVALAREVAGRPGLRFRGVMAWEGQARRHLEPAPRKAEAERAVGVLVQTAEAIRAAGIPVEIVSCGGTGTHEYTSRVPGVTEIQAGGIIFNDMMYTTMGLDHEYALTVFSTVISRPTPTRIICDSGKKTFSTDGAVPKPLGVGEVASASFSAEHAKIELKEPNTTLKVGDRLEWIVGYGDTTVHLHEVMYGARNGRVEVAWPVAGRGKIR